MIFGDFRRFLLILVVFLTGAYGGAYTFVGPRGHWGAYGASGGVFGGAQAGAYPPGAYTQTLGSFGR